MSKKKKKTVYSKKKICILIVIVLILSTCIYPLFRSSTIFKIEKRLHQIKLEQKKDDKKVQKKSKPVVLSKEEIEKQTKERLAAEKKRVSKLARLYNEMKPEDAAKILEGMEDDIVISILQKMDESQVSQVLTKFDTDRAANITKIMYNGLPKRPMQNPPITEQEQNPNANNN